MLLIMLQSLVQPSITWALQTPGPHQPEYMSYEEAGSPDMVNLITGDFTFNIPLLEVPGPEGGFSLPLTYNAGIGLEQEASWVGLGFNINVGAITRQINQHPDDAFFNEQKVIVKNPGVRGWSASILNLGRVGWNTSKGYNGAFSIAGMINLNYDNSSTDFKVVGLQSFDGELFASQALTFASLAAPPGPGNTRLGNFTKQMAWSVGAKALTPSGFSFENVNSSSPNGYYEYNVQTRDGFLNLYTDYWIWLDNTKYEMMFGVLNLSSAYLDAYNTDCIQSSVSSGPIKKILPFFNDPKFYTSTGEINLGTTLDANYFMSGSEEYKDATAPALLATDSYQVSGAGISGSIAPYRFDAGSVGASRNMYEHQLRLNVLNFAEYKVPFRYKNSISNSYLFTTQDATIPNFGLKRTLNNNCVTFELDDPSFGNQRVRPDIQQKNYKIDQANHIEWLTDKEIDVTPNSFSNGFLDYFSGSERHEFRKYLTYTPSVAFRFGFTSMSIGGFSITNSNGVTYHYALPTICFSNSVAITSLSNPAENAAINQLTKYSGTWLLTGITGPDFVDRNNNGAIDEADWGYWIKFNYSRFRQDYQWETEPIVDATGKTESQSTGQKELYYLNSIESKSHVAIFLKNVRKDNKSSNSLSTLSLSEISLLTREDYNYLIDAYSLPKDSGKISSWWNVSSFFPSSGVTQPGIFLTQKSIKRIRFIQSYDLCPNTTNSDAPNKGKLTLTKLSILGRNGISALPDFKFEYANNSAYNKNKWDGWGMYNSNGTTSHNSHNASNNDSDGYSWSLNKITTPLGSTIEVSYERDDYASINGLPITTKKGGNIRVSSIVTYDLTKTYKSIYQYKLDDGNSSGVIVREPDYEGDFARSLNDNPFPNYPITPVMYSKVTVLSGKLVDQSDYHTKTVYEFETPHKSMIEENSDQVQLNVWDILSVKRNIFNHTSKIGTVKMVTVYDKNNAITRQSTFNYTEQLTNNLGISNQGCYSSTTLMHDKILATVGTGVQLRHKMTRTSEVTFPYALRSVTTQSQDGFTTTETNTLWDFITGQVLQKKSKSSLGFEVLHVTKPAYYFYPSMGSKAEDINNKNMLTQNASNYVYQLDANGNAVGLLAATAQTWKNDWATYRYLDGNSNYTEGAEGPNVWRKHQSWAYIGNYANLRADGSLTFSSANEFNFAPGAANNGWQKTGEVTRYNHYSAALEGKDLNNIFSASKNDINQQQVYASATNANYFEFAYSGAEDWAASGTGLYLGGEVAKGAGTAIYKTPGGNETHTGQVAIQLGAGAKGFVYKPASLTPNRTYRVSAWTNSPNGAIYYTLNKLNGGTEQTILPVSTQFVNGWYQINALVPVSSFTSLEVGVKSTNGTISFDDFRFQPLDGALTANVYDPVTSAVTFSLDNQNMYTQYEYNDRGQLVKTYSESFKYGVKLVSENKVNYRRFNTNP
jgi:hypothetical protein